MGFFSWNCKACGKSIRSHYTNDGHKHWMGEVVAVTKNGSLLRGEYDGYGRINETELPDGGEFTLWHNACWEDCGSPRLFNGQSPSANDQGYFCSEVMTIFPPKHDAKEIERTHTEEAKRILEELVPVLTAMQLGSMSTEAVLEVLRVRHEKNMAELRAELDDKKSDAHG